MKITTELLNEIERSTNRFYIVIVGRKPGIYSNYELARQQTDGFPNNKHCLAKNKYDAVKALIDGIKKYCGDAFTANSDIEETYNSALNVYDRF